MAPVLLLSTVSVLALGTSLSRAQSLPTGGSVVSISQSGSSLLGTQNSYNAILPWDSFSSGGGASAHFANGTGATLNRVTSNLPSAKDGVVWCVSIG